MKVRWTTKSLGIMARRMMSHLRPERAPKRRIPIMVEPTALTIIFKRLIKILRNLKTRNNRRKVKKSLFRKNLSMKEKTRRKLRTVKDIIWRAQLSRRFRISQRKAKQTVRGKCP